MRGRRRRLVVALMALALPAAITAAVLQLRGEAVTRERPAEAAPPPAESPAAPAPAPVAAVIDDTSGLRDAHASSSAGESAPAVETGEAASRPRKPIFRLTAARGPSWLAVRAGSARGRLLFEGVLAPGGTLLFARRALWVGAGRPQNLTFVVNRRRVGTRAKGPATFVVTAAGVRILPAPASPPASGSRPVFVAERSPAPPAFDRVASPAVASRVTATAEPAPLPAPPPLREPVPLAAPLKP